MNSESALASLEDALSEEAGFLAPRAEQIASRWSELYLNTFGRAAFFSAQRVQKIFQELVDLFVGCLQEKRLDLYLESLRNRGSVFSRLGVPFEEIIVSLHLFEEICLKELTDHRFTSHTLWVMRELHHRGLAALAISYFECTKTEIQKITEGVMDENENLKKELAETRDSLFTRTAKELASMELLISGINRKLRQRVYQLSRIQKISEVLDGEVSLPKLLKIASRQLLALCPISSNCYFGLFDEDRKRVHLYHQESTSSLECGLLKSFYFSELTEVFQAALYDESKKHLHVKDPEQVPPILLEIFSVQNQKDFMLIPIRRYREVTGFIFLGMPVDGFFTKNSHKFYQRAGLVISRAITNAVLFTKSKQRDQLELTLEVLGGENPKHRSLETTLDFCLGSLIDILGVERSSLMRYDQEKQELRVCAAKGYKIYPIGGAPIKWGEGIAGMALKDRKIVSVAKMKDLKSGQTPEIKVKSLLCVPLIDAERPLGVVNLSTLSYYKHFEKSDIEMAHHIISRMTRLLKDLSDRSPKSIAR